MKDQPLEKLMQIAGPSLCERERVWGGVPPQLRALYRERNGFFAFESALHVFPQVSCAGERGLQEWNSETLWRFEYGDISSGLFFFAEDAFGGQFCLADDRICTFDPETGRTETMAPDIAAWASQLLDDYEVATGYPLLHQWQRLNGPLASGMRLVPKTPFVMGGDFTVDNLTAMESVAAMKSRGNIARQIRDLPDAATVELKVVP